MSSHRPNGGHASVLNHGFREARGDYCAKCDADDIWQPRSSNVKPQRCEAHPEIDVASAAPGSLASRKDRACRTQAGSSSGEISHGRLYRANFVCASSTLLRRSLYERLGPLRRGTSARRTTTTGWLAAGRRRFYHYPCVLVHFRRHDAQQCPRDKLKMQRGRSCIGAQPARRLWSVSRSLPRRVMARDLRNIARTLSDQEPPEEARAACELAAQSPSVRGLAWVLCCRRPSLAATACRDVDLLQAHPPPRGRRVSQIRMPGESPRSDKATADAPVSLGERPTLPRAARGGAPASAGRRSPAPPPRSSSSPRWSSSRISSPPPSSAATRWR